MSVGRTTLGRLRGGGEVGDLASRLGARRLPGGGDNFAVFADPIGHPFCLVEF